jgi:hypothetical protein
MSKTKIQRCVEMDEICTQLMRIIAESDAVDDSYALGLLEPLVDMTDALQRFHRKLVVIHQTELRGLS